MLDLWKATKFLIISSISPIAVAKELCKMRRRGSDVKLEEL